MKVREVGKMAGYVRNNQWLLRLGGLGGMDGVFGSSEVGEAGGFHELLEALLFVPFDNPLCHGLLGDQWPFPPQLKANQELTPTSGIRLFN